MKKGYLIVLIILITSFTNNLFAAATFEASLNITHSNAGSPESPSKDKAFRAYRGITFNSDGSKMYLLLSKTNDSADSSTDDIFEYDLGTPWDISGTVLFNSEEGIRSKCHANQQFQQPGDLHFNNDGSKLIMTNELNNSNDRDICEVILDTVYDISEMQDNNDGIELDGSGTGVNVGDNEALGLDFNSDGTKMFVTTKSNKIYELNLTTGFDISTASDSGQSYTFTSDFSEGIATGGGSHGMRFNDDGTLLFVVNRGKDTIHQYSLSTGFDLSSTITHLGSIDMTDQYEALVGGSTFGVANYMEFNGDGTKFYATFSRWENNVILRERILQYSLDCPYGIVDCGPTLSSCSPADGAIGVGLNDNIVLTFSEAVDVESGNIVIKKSSDDSVFETIDVTGSSVTGTGTTSISVDVSTTFEVDTNYYITIDSTAFDDASNLSYAGINDSTTCNFSTGQPNPLLNDKDLVGSIEAQVEMSHRVIKQTTTTVMHRIEWLRRHKDKDDLTNQNIKFQFSNAMLASLTNIIPASAAQNTIPKKLPNNWFMWSEGDISIGKIGEGLASSAKEIDTNGVTIGADNRTNDDRMYGAALRIGKDEVDVGSSGTSLDTDAFSLSLYGTVAKNDNNFVDGILGVSRLKTDHIRKKNSNTLTGERHGKQVYSTINFNKIFDSSNFNFNPTGRIDLGYTELGSYNENGVNPLRYYKHEIITGIASIGMMLDDTIHLKSFTLKRIGRLEYNGNFSPSTDATLSYISDPATNYTLDVSNEATHNLRSGIGFDLSNSNGFSLITNYERNQGKDSGHSDSIYFALGYVSNKKKTEYALSIGGSENIKTGLNIVKNVRDFDLKFNFDTDLLNNNKNHNANISINKVF